MTKVWNAGVAWFIEDCPSHAAGIAFYTILSLAPFLVLALSVASLFVDGGVAVAQLRTQISGIVGNEGAELIAAMVTQAARTDYGTVAAVIAVGAMVFAATGAIAELQRALDTLLGKQQRHVRLTVLNRVRLLGVAMALALGFPIVVSLIPSAVASAVVSWAAAGGDFTDPLPLLAASDVVSTLLVTLVFAGLLRFLPTQPLEAGPTWVGAVSAGLLFGAAKFGIAWYMEDAVWINAYGAAGAVVVVMLWVFTVACVFLFGALVARENSVKRARYPRGMTMPFLSSRASRLNGSRFYVRR